MFTTVNSARKKLKQTINLDAKDSSALQNSSSFEVKKSLLVEFFNFFSISNDYFNLQLAIFSLTFLLSLLITIISENSILDVVAKYIVFNDMQFSLWNLVPRRRNFGEN